MSCKSESCPELPQGFVSCQMVGSKRFPGRLQDLNVGLHPWGYTSAQSYWDLLSSIPDDMSARYAEIYVETSV